MEEAFSSLASSTHLEVSRAPALSSIVIDSELKRTGPTLQAVPALVPAPAEDDARISSLAKSRGRFRPRLALMISDVFALALGLAAALYLVHQPGDSSVDAAFVANIVLSLPLFAGVVVALALNNLYSKSPGQVLKSSFNELHDIVYGLGIAGCCVLGVDHLFGSLERQATLEPVTIVIALLLAVVLIPTGRGASRAILRSVRAEQCRVLVVGSGMMVQHLLRYLSWDPRITVVGCVDDDPAPGTSVLGTIEDLPRLVEDLDIHQVMVGFSRTHPANAILRLQALNDRVAISIVPRYFEMITWRSSVKEIAGLALIDVAPARLNLAARAVKRTCDLVLGSVLLLFALPGLVVVGVSIKLTSPGPVLFRQERTGKGNKPFTIYKLRTMAHDAEQRHSQLVNSNEMDGPLFKIRADPRTTRIGRFLRKTSLDEAPQLLNVLRGDMSLVGPRPFVPSEASAIDGSAQRRFEVRPGMTGLWQVSGRSELTFEEMQRLDYLYVASWSIWWDFRILWMTPARVFRGHGAF
jgi:exopolysaccharide biosynthesis polyprenyl glycosylphosphotransferase